MIPSIDEDREQLELPIIADGSINWFDWLEDYPAVQNKAEDT